jgi:hypothetical protein
MDPIRYGFVQTIIDFMESLPPLLQFLAGVFVTIGIFKVLLTIANFVQAKRDKKE